MAVDEEITSLARLRELMARDRSPRVRVEAAFALVGLLAEGIARLNLALEVLDAVVQAVALSLDLGAGGAQLVELDRGVVDWHEAHASH